MRISASSAGGRGALRASSAVTVSSARALAWANSLPAERIAARLRRSASRVSICDHAVSSFSFTPPHASTSREAETAADAGAAAATTAAGALAGTAAGALRTATAWGAGGVAGGFSSSSGRDSGNSSASTIASHRPPMRSTRPQLNGGGSYQMRGSGMAPFRLPTSRPPPGLRGPRSPAGATRRAIHRPEPRAPPSSRRLPPRRPGSRGARARARRAWPPAHCDARG